MKTSYTSKLVYRTKNVPNNNSTSIRFKDPENRSVKKLVSDNLARRVMFKVRTEYLHQLLAAIDICMQLLQVCQPYKIKILGEC